MKQFFARNPVSIDQLYQLDDDQAHHLFDVLRTEEKETIRLIRDNSIFLCHIADKPYVRVFEKEEGNKREIQVTLCAALIKQDKWEWMLQKACELGVSRIVPFESSRTVVHISSEKQRKKSERWLAILEAACKQCNRTDPVILEPVTSLDQLDEYLSECNVLAYEKEDQNHHLADSLKDNPISVTAVVGPEGGFSTEEVEKLINMGYIPCSLGNQILRAETAAIYILCAVEYQYQIARLENKA